jgi:hypothetical protein
VRKELTQNSASILSWGLRYVSSSPKAYLSQVVAGSRAPDANSTRPGMYFRHRVPRMVEGARTGVPDTRSQDLHQLEKNSQFLSKPSNLSDEVVVISFRFTYLGGTGRSSARL